MRKVRALPTSISGQRQNRLWLPVVSQLAIDVTFFAVGQIGRGLLVDPNWFQTSNFYEVTLDVLTIPPLAMQPDLLADKLVQINTFVPLHLSQFFSGR